MQVPRYYRPWPHQVRAWARRERGKYVYDLKLWARQLGKDTDDIQWLLNKAWNNPGTQSAYVGLDNVWINNNIFNKYIDGRTHWMDYPDSLIDPKATSKEVFMNNNPDDLAPARIKFIGFLNQNSLIGSSYDNFVISEASLYPTGAFDYIRPIWERKIKTGNELNVCFNGTPRGTRNVMYNLLRSLTGMDDPNDFPGEHLRPNGNVFVDKMTIRDLMIPDPDSPGGFKRAYSEQDIEVLKGQYLREFGNLNFYMQENECDFTVVNAGLVYLGIEQLEKEGRFTSINLNPEKPVYMAWDISSKEKTTDATTCIVFQVYNGRMFLYDYYEERGKPLVECVSELSARGYFHNIRFAVLPWDADRTASSESPIDEVRRMFPAINWHQLGKERVDRGIQIVRKQLPNMVINKDKCDWVLECFQNYEYRRLEAAEDWSAKPRHSRHSHIMDSVRYACMGMKEIEYFQLNDTGVFEETADSYGGFYDEPAKQGIWEPKVRVSDGGVYTYG